MKLRYASRNETTYQGAPAMSYCEKDIMYETKYAFVLKEKDGYGVYRNGITHAIGDSAYALTGAGLSIARARCDYITKRKEGSS